MYLKDINNQFYTTNSIMNEFPSPTSLMTPNTIKTIEQSILASLEGSSGSGIVASSATGSFVPPLPTSSTITLVSTWQGGQVDTQVDDTEEDDETPPPSPSRNKRQKLIIKKGGRKPKSSSDNPEEEQRRSVRRERNKLAAARCRKRRVDHTNLLINETEELDVIRRGLQSEISRWQRRKEDLEFMLEAHLGSCTMDVKKPKRPTTLPVLHNNDNIPLTTPSNGLISFGDIDWSELPSTGLTPTAINNNTLVTPLVTPSTANSILMSLNNKFVSL